MGKDKLRKFRENLTFACFVQPDFDEVFRHDHPLKGHWGRDFFHNDHPIVLELGCGKGEYTVALAERDPSRNYIGVDIKGARMWRGAKTATERGMRNVGFLRTRIEFITSLFAEGEVAELWITFPDPQLKSRRAKKRLTSPLFLEYYAQLLQPDGWINLKTDSQHLYGYTNEVIRHFGLPCEVSNPDIYGSTPTRCSRSRPPTNSSSCAWGCRSPTRASRSAGSATSPGSNGRRTRNSKRTTKKHERAGPEACSFRFPASGSGIPTDPTVSSTLYFLIKVPRGVRISRRVQPGGSTASSSCTTPSGVISSPPKPNITACSRPPAPVMK